MANRAPRANFSFAPVGGVWRDGNVLRITIPLTGYLSAGLSFFFNMLPKKADRYRASARSYPARLLRDIRIIDSQYISPRNRAEWIRDPCHQNSKSTLTKSTLRSPRSMPRSFRLMP